MFSEFKEFIARGNVIDLAVGIIVGAAFTAIVNSVVGDLINPVISLFLAGVDVSSLFLSLSSIPYESLAAAEEAGAAVFAYGRFLMAVINFLIIAVVVFVIVRMINRFRKREEPVAEEPAIAPVPTQEELLAEIRDLLRQTGATNFAVEYEYAFKDQE